MLKSYLSQTYDILLIICTLTPEDYTGKPALLLVVDV